jgi:hypothetical protein
MVFYAQLDRLRIHEGQHRCVLTSHAVCRYPETEGRTEGPIRTPAITAFGRIDQTVSSILGALSLSHSSAAIRSPFFSSTALATQP